MKISLRQLRRLIKEEVTLAEIGGPRGGLRSSQKGKKAKQQYKIGRVEDENRELSFSEAEMLYPGSTDAWAEIVPSEFPTFPFANDPLVVKRRSVFFKEGDKLTVAFANMPQLTLATWDPMKGAGEGDWDLVGDMQESRRLLAKMIIERRFPVRKRRRINK